MPTTVSGGQASPTAARSASQPLVVLFVALFLVVHLPFLAPSLEDVDSINFAMGVRQFDVAHHQPHPPGYPIYIVAAKVLRVVVPNEIAALSLLSVLAGALGVWALFLFFRRLAADLRASGVAAW